MELTNRGLELLDRLENTTSIDDPRHHILGIVLHNTEEGENLTRKVIIDTVQDFAKEEGITFSDSKLNSTIDKLVSSGYLEDVDRPYDASRYGY